MQLDIDCVLATSCLDNMRTVQIRSSRPLFSFCPLWVYSHRADLINAFWPSAEPETSVMVYFVLRLSCAGRLRRVRFLSGQAALLRLVVGWNHILSVWGYCYRTFTRLAFRYVVPQISIGLVRNIKSVFSGKYLISQLKRR